MSLTNSEVVDTHAADSTVAAPPTNKMTTRQTLDTLIPEVRDIIIDYLLADPEYPDFEATKPGRKYYHYLALLFTTKNLSQGMREAMARAQNLVVIASNLEYLPFNLYIHGVPIVSDHAVEKVRCHILTIHLTQPENLVFGDAPKNMILLRKEDLNGVGAVVRMMSLCRPHAPEPFMQNVGNGVYRVPDAIVLGMPRMHLTLDFETPFDKDIGAETKIAILGTLSRANRVGTITINGLDATRSNLTGYSETFRTFDPQGHETYNEWAQELLEQYNHNRSYDAWDLYTEITYMIDQIDIAFEHNNMIVAGERSGSAFQFIDWVFEDNPCIELFSVRGDDFWFEKLALKVRSRFAEVQCYFGCLSGARRTLHNLEAGFRPVFVGSDEGLKFKMELHKKVRARATSGERVPVLCSRLKSDWSGKEVDREYREERKIAQVPESGLQVMNAVED